MFHVKHFLFSFHLREMFHVKHFPPLNHRARHGAISKGSTFSFEDKAMSERIEYFYEIRSRPFTETGDPTTRHREYHCVFNHNQRRGLVFSYIPKNLSHR